MDHYNTRLIKSEQGTGTLFMDGDIVDEVDYSYQIIQAFTILQDSSGETEIPGIKRMDGSLILHNKMVDLLGEEKYELKTRDNELIPLFIYKLDPMNNCFYFKRGRDA